MIFPQNEEKVLFGSLKLFLGSSQNGKRKVLDIRLGFSLGFKRREEEE